MQMDVMCLVCCGEGELVELVEKKEEHRVGWMHLWCSALFP